MKPHNRMLIDALIKLLVPEMEEEAPKPKLSVIQGGKKGLEKQDSKK